jgi:hypothetical protein
MRVQCTDCQSILNSSRPVPLGSRVRCPRCGATFRVTADVPAEVAQPPVKEALRAPVKPAGPKDTTRAVGADPIPVAELVEEEPVEAAELDEEEAIPAAVHVKKKTKRGSSVGLWISVAAVLFAVVLGGGAILYYVVSKGRIALALAGGSEIAGWEPDPVLVQFLDDEMKLTPADNLHIRISKKAPIQSNAEHAVRWWRITQLGSGLDGEGTNLNVQVLDKPPGFDSNPLMQQAFLHMPQSSHSQSGTINGMPFTRFRIDGENNSKGFMYFGVVDNHLILLSSLESEKTLSRLRLAESAVLTLRKD